MHSIQQRLRSSAEAFNENTVYTQDGDPVRLSVQAEECEEAAGRIDDLGSLLSIAARQGAVMQAEIARLKQPSWFYDANDSERCFYSPHEVIDWIDPDAGDYLIEVTTARPCPSIWCSVRVTDDPDAGERFIFTEHATEAEARAALGDPQ